MNAAPLLLLHGAAGNLDELLICGVGLAVVLLVVFIVESRAPKEASSENETVKDEQAD